MSVMGILEQDVPLLTAIGVSVALSLVALVVILRWKWRSVKWWRYKKRITLPVQPEDAMQCQTVHRLCPHNNVVQSYNVQQKDSLDEHLDVLTRKLAEKEGRLRLSKSKIRETQYEIDNLHAIDQDVRSKYREIMESLRSDLMTNERECKKLQEQIEWVSRRRAELKDEVQRGQRLYGEAAAELACNLAELQRGRVTEKYLGQNSFSTIRHRKEPQLPTSVPMHVSTGGKTSHATSVNSSHRHQYVNSS